MAAPGTQLPAPIERKVTIPAEQTLELDGRFNWIATVEAVGYWAEGRMIAAGQAADVELRLHRAGKVHAHVEMPARSRSGDLSVQFTPVPAAEPAPPAGFTDCPVREGVAECVLPVGVFDLRLRVGLATPSYHWGVRVSPGHPVDLGTLRPRPGGSVVGWLETEDGQPAVGGRLELVPLSGEASDDSLERRLRLMVRGTSANGRGFFQFDGLPPGQYTLTASFRGYPPVQVGPVTVSGASESQLIDRVVLAQPVTFHLSVQPPHDPYGKAWAVALRKVDGNTSVRSRVSAKGRWSRAGLAPGTYEMTLTGGDEESRWLVEQVELRRDQSRFRFKVPLVEVRGQVRRGREPLQCRLWFRGQPRAQHILFSSDAEGRFRGFLTRTGTWSVTLVTESLELGIRLPSVEVHESSHGPAEVEVVVPDTRLEGEVVDESGRGIPAAQVMATIFLPPGVPAQFVSEADGKFTAHGLPPGPGVVRASDGEGRVSEWVPINLAEGVGGSWIRLMVQSAKEVRGRLYSANGPVFGATIVALPELTRTRPSATFETATDAAGGFTLPVAADTNALDIVVASPGFALRMLKASVTTPLVEIAVEPQGGTLVLKMPTDEANPSATPMIVHEGVLVPARLLARFQGAQRSTADTLTIPNVAAGEYSFCLGSAAAARAGGAHDASAAGCSRGYLPPYGELSLELPTRHP